MNRWSKYIFAAISPNDPANARAKARNKPIATHRAVFVEQSRFGCEELRRLRAERGTGSARRVDETVRAAFIKSKRT